MYVKEIVLGESFINISYFPIAYTYVSVYTHICIYMNVCIFFMGKEFFNL